MSTEQPTPASFTSHAGELSRALQQFITDIEALEATYCLNTKTANQLAALRQSANDALRNIHRHTFDVLAYLHATEHFKIIPSPDEDTLR